MSSDKKKPAYLAKHVAVVETDRTKREVFTEIAAVWKSDSGVMTLDIPPGITLSGRVVLMPYQERAAGKTSPAEPNDYFKGEDNA